MQRILEKLYGAIVLAREASMELTADAEDYDPFDPDPHQLACSLAKDNIDTSVFDLVLAAERIEQDMGKPVPQLTLAERNRTL